MLQFNEDGLLPPQDYPMTIDQLRGSLLIHGIGNDSPWDQNKRLLLVNHLEILVNQLHIVGIHEIFIDGSFVEDKASPGDIDGYFIVDPLASYSNLGITIEGTNNKIKMMRRRGYGRAGIELINALAVLPWYYKDKDKNDELQKKSVA